MRQPQTIFCAPALRVIEHAYRAVSPPLMERAGAAAAAAALKILDGDRRVPLIVAGPGNNGGDAFVVARLLKAQGLEPKVVFCGDASRLPEDARLAHAAWLSCGGSLADDIDGSEPYSMVVDGLFGIGLARAIEGRFADWVLRINALACPVLALDIASGVDSETGAVRGVAVRATHCATFIGLKPGLLTLDGPDHCGTISVHDLDLDLAVACDDGRRNQTTGQTVAPALFAEHLRPRRRNTHKGSYGSVGIIGGAAGMAGAALLAGRAALMLGAGRVHLGMLKRLSVDYVQPELMLRCPDDVFDLATCLAIGPGLGQAHAALNLLRRVIPAPIPVLIDADALNLLAAHPVLAHQLRRRQAATLLTPHPAEAARLLSTDIATVQTDRRGAALELAQRYRAHVVLKGCGSVIALADGRWFINTSGNPGLASAGTGDVLSGIAIGLLAQNWPPDHALLGAVHIHGAAADLCVAEGTGPIGLSAGELMIAARRLLNIWVGGGYG